MPQIIRGSDGKSNFIHGFVTFRYNPAAMKESKQRQQFWAGMGISFLCLAAIFLFISPTEIWQALRTARYGYLGLSALGILMFMIMRAIRWRFMLNNDIPWRQVFDIQNVGYMLTNTLPFRIGDVARAVLIGNVPPVTISRGVSTMVVERILDMLFIVTLLPLTLASVERLPDWMQAAARVSGILAIGAIVMLIVAANQRPFASRLATTILNHIQFLDTPAWVKRLDDLLAGLSSLTRFKDGFLLIILTIFTWLPIVFSYYSTLFGVNLEPSLAEAGFVVCAAAFSIALPSSPGQIGVFHAGVIAALRILGQPEAESASFAFLYHGLNMIESVVLGIIGIYSTGATFNNVVASTRAFMRRKEETINDKR